MGAHIPVIADAVLSPIGPTVKYGRHEITEMEGRSAVFELQSPDGEKRGRVDRSEGVRY